MAKKAMAGERRKRRREWVAVASEAVQTAGEAKLITDQQARQLSRAFRRPPISEQIRAAFVGELEPGQLDGAEHPSGKFDFDALIELLIGFFPKMLRMKKFADLVRNIMGLQQ
jgi:hypothetical protein